MSETLVRCSHCRGFYEADRGRCKWCDYETVVAGADARPVIYPDRATARAVQVSEYEQLPPEAHEDPMGPPPTMLSMLCHCIHCGPFGHVFEAVEMRWMANERMWACPCTTCGGRGFQFDIHPAERIWECAECHHWYRPERFTYDAALCPKCGSTMANGWFDDPDEDEFDDDEEWEAELEASALPPPETDAGPDHPGDEPATWDVPDLESDAIDWEQETQPWYPGKDEDDEAAEWEQYRERIPDDIDFPRHFRDEEPPASRSDGSAPLDEDDIPF